MTPRPWTRFALPLLLASIPLANCVGPASVSSSRDLSGYPQATLTNRSLSLNVYLPAPDGFYRGPRFDWSGIISRLDFQGHTLFAPRHVIHIPQNQDNALGTPDEFGMDSALNYNDVNPGEPFLKIGVGALIRVDAGEYQFNAEYPILTPVPWTNRFGANFVESTQTQPTFKGWGYTYTKRLELLGDEAGFIITRTLTNTGTREINTTHYCHNFLLVDQKPVGPGYTLEYPGAPKFAEGASTQDSISIHDRTIQFDRAIVPGKPVYAPLDGLSTNEPYRMKMREASSGLELEIRGDRPLSKAVLYAEPAALCPEAFITLKIPPGQTQKWRTEYRLKIVK